jgi:hypothetical protein
VRLHRPRRARWLLGGRSLIATRPSALPMISRPETRLQCHSKKAYAGAQMLSRFAMTDDVRQYTDGPVTEVAYIHVEYGHFEEYIDWLNSTWKPTMEASKKSGLIIDYKVFKLTPKSPDQPNMILWTTFKNGAAAFDHGVELEEVAKKVIGSTELQNKARIGRNEHRRVLGKEYVREVILK